MEYRSAIVDECGALVGWISELDGDEIEKILDDHPEYEIRCLECQCDGYTCGDFESFEYYDEPF